MWLDHWRLSFGHAAAIRKIKKGFSTYTALQATYAASAALCITDGAGVQPTPQPKPVHMELGLQPYIALVCHFNGLHLCLLIQEG